MTAIDGKLSLVADKKDNAIDDASCTQAHTRGNDFAGWRHDGGVSAATAAACSVSL